ncbi:MAG TPA: hypothetical protein VNT51_12160 [Miltoncostaeaceae bacterium]|nr:hypothetical protein [Miltoncostaeaceae bacterium]
MDLPVRPRPGVRLTLRGRLLLLLAVLLLPVAATAALVAGVLVVGASRAADPPPARGAVVRPGDALWSVARRCAPEAAPVATIGEPVATIELIRRLNALRGRAGIPVGACG